MILFEGTYICYFTSPKGLLQNLKMKKAYKQTRTLQYHGISNQTTVLLLIRSVNSFLWLPKNHWQQILKSRGLFFIQNNESIWWDASWNYHPKRGNRHLTGKFLKIIICAVSLVVVIAWERLCFSKVTSIL